MHGAEAWINLMQALTLVAVTRCTAWRLYKVSHIVWLHALPSLPLMLTGRQQLLQ